MAACRKFRKQAHFFRSGECTAEEQAAWAEHRRHCPECEALARQIKILAEEIHRARSKNVALEAPERLTRKIMISLTALKPAIRHENGNSFVCVRRLPMQWAQAIVLITLAVGFLWEGHWSASARQEQDLTRMLALQNKTAVAHTPLPLLLTRRHRSCVDKLQSWVAEHNQPLFMAKSTVLRKSYLTQKQHWQTRKIEIEHLLQSCGWSEAESAYLLKQGASFLHYHFQ